MAYPGVCLFVARTPTPGPVNNIYDNMNIYPTLCPRHLHLQLLDPPPPPPGPVLATPLECLSGHTQGRRLKKMPGVGHYKSTRANPCYRGAVGRKYCAQTTLPSKQYSGRLSVRLNDSRVVWAYAQTTH